MPKLLVLKPILWNPYGYQGPSGEATSAGYAKHHGYGHEEWNGRDDWIWRSWRVFDTQSRPRLHAYAATGDLGILMITVVNGRQCVVGAACNVYGNDAREQKSIARELGLRANGKEVWKLPAVRKAFGDDRAAFREHWGGAHNCVRWRCPPSHFLWFHTPIFFDANDVAPRTPPRTKVVAMHSSYQSILPERAVALLGDRLPPSHSILGWLLDGEFDMVGAGRSSSVPSTSGDGVKSAGGAVEPHVRYLQEYEVFVTPRHHILQKDFVAFLKQSGSEGIKPDLERVDVRFTLPGRGLVLAEIKPTEPANVRFAIRAAMGQLLDYRQKCSKEARLLIVISDKPQEKEDLDLPLSNGFGLAWRTNKGFSMTWPGAAKA